MSVTLDKAPDNSPFGGHDSTTSYPKNPDGTIPEYELSIRRYLNGSRVSSEWSYWLQSNDLRDLKEFYQYS